MGCPSSIVALLPALIGDLGRYKVKIINEKILGEASVDIFAVADFDNQNQ